MRRIVAPVVLGSVPRGGARPRLVGRYGQSVPSGSRRLFDGGARVARRDGLGGMEPEEKQDGRDQPKHGGNEEEP